MTGHLPTLDGWRALAILAVLFCHGGATLFSEHGVAPSPGLLDLSVKGSYGVDIFFGISGFLIASRLLDERRRAGRVSLQRFYIRRACRILPAFLAYVGVMGLIAGYVPLGIDRREWWASLLLVRNYLPDPPRGGWYTGHFWSLAVEEHFYLLWPPLLAFGLARSTRRRTGVLALIVAGWSIFEQRHHWLSGVLPVASSLNRTDVRADGLLWGCWVALLLDDPARRERLARRFAGMGGPAILAGLLTLLIVRPPLAKVTVAFVVPFALAATVLHPRTRVGRALEWGPLAGIGRISYGLYLWQQLFLVPPKSLPRPPLGRWQLWPLNFVAVVLCGAISYALVERPMIRLGHRMAPSGRPGGRATAPRRPAGPLVPAVAKVPGRARREGVRVG